MIFITEKRDPVGQDSSYNIISDFYKRVTHVLQCIKITADLIEVVR